METPKEKAIKAAYGEYWERVEDYVDDNGWCNAFFNIAGDHFKKTQSKKNKWRPNALTNLETNNGWTRIESEEDLPKEYDVDYFCFHKNGRLTIRSFYEYLGWGEFEAEILDQSDITHYQPIETPKPPLF